MKILLVEHNQKLIDKLKTLLSNNSYLIDVSKDGQDSLETVNMFEYDLLIINVNITKIDGISLCKQIRKNGKQMPILLFTEQSDHENKRIAGLDSGADDFVVINPSEEDILLAKIRALFRRSGGILPPILSWRNIELDPVKHEVKFKNNPLILTPKEYNLLELFMRNSQRIYSLSNIIDAIWSYEETPNETTIRSHIKSLRKKLNNAGVPDDFIETVYGVGYRLKTSNENDRPEMIDQKNRSSNDNNGNNHNGKNNPVEIDPDLVEIFQQSHTLLDARINFLESVVSSLEKEEFNKQLREKATLESHKLISSLGTFGFHDESEIARSLNNIFKTEKNINRQKTKLISTQVKALRSVLETCPLPPISQEFTKGEVSTILMITSEISLLEKLDIEASKWGIQTEMATNLKKAKEIITKNKPNLILLDLEISQNSEDCLIFLEQINHQKTPIPVLILTNKDNLKERVKISSLGGKGFLSKSLLIPDIIKTAINLLEQSIPKESRIMVVDDDPIALAFVKSYLEPWGLKVKVVEKIEDFWQTLNDFCPYLLILDMEMPNMGGFRFM
jgi:DNA-binding response OmpR family regulator